MSKTLDGLLKDYNAKLARYNRMCKWLETASDEDKKKQEKNILAVIRDCSQLIVEIERYRPMTLEEVQQGFGEGRIDSG